MAGEEDVSAVVEHSVELHRGSADDQIGLGFSILGLPDLPPIIYDILENSPAAASGKVEAGDVIVKINETDVHSFSTKEVLKCLRLSGNPVRLQLKRDPVIKDKVIHLLSNQAHMDLSSSEICPKAEPVDDAFSVEEKLPRFPTKPKRPRFEAFTMTGDLILNLSKNQQMPGLLPRHQNKVDCLRSQRHRTNHVNSVPTSPNEADFRLKRGSSSPSNPSSLEEVNNSAAYSFQAGVRTSRSEDHLQFQKDGLSAVDIEVEDDVASSLNTLLDTRQDLSSGNSLGDLCSSDPSSHTTVLQIAMDAVEEKYEPTNNKNQLEIAKCSCNSPLKEKRRRHNGENRRSGGSFDKNTNENRSSGHYDSKRNSGHFEKDQNYRHSGHYDRCLKHSGSSDPPSNGGSEQSSPSPPATHTPSPPTSSSAILNPSDMSASNISSPDFQEEMTLDMLSAMEVSDPSDSDSTILVSDRSVAREEEHRVICWVEGGETVASQCSQNNRCNGYMVISGSVEEQAGFTDEESDVESLDSFHYSPKAVDLPSAIRLAKRLYTLDGFKKSDISRHLSKNNEFSKTVAEEYLKFFYFERLTLDTALRRFLQQLSLAGETQERERVLVHFSKRYLDCNPGSFKSTDAVHTLTCALMLLNTDLHGPGVGRKMTCEEFIENLRELNDGENFPRDSLKFLYQSIANSPVEWAMDDDMETLNGDLHGASGNMEKLHETVNLNSSNPFLAVPDQASGVEYKKGYVMRKCCLDINGKRTPLGKRGWKMLYCTLRDMVLYLHKDEHGFRKSQSASSSMHNAIRIHHSLATKAQDYTKKQYVFRLQTAERAEYLFQTSDSKELQSWIDTINFVCASCSAQPLASAVGSENKFQRPLLPSTHTKLSLREQLADHEDRIKKLEKCLEEHRKKPPDRSAKSLTISNYKEKDAYLQYEIRRYTTYAKSLRIRFQMQPDLDLSEEGGLIGPPVPDRRPPIGR